MKIEITADPGYVDEIVTIHMETFTGFFLTFLGRGFLRKLYEGFLAHPDSDVIIALEDGKVVGFCAFSRDLSGFYKYLVKKKLFSFAWYALGGFLRKPSVFFRLFRALTYADKSVREDSYIELSSIGVSPEHKNEGIGSQLVRKLIELSASTEHPYIKLETDRDENAAANHFYQKNGFVLHHSYQTPEGRWMNEYRYDRREKHE